MEKNKKVAKELIFEQIANKKGKYINFTGKIDYKYIKADVVNANFELKDLIIWENGIWKDGAWKSGLWKDGTWENGIWYSGTWENGTWNDGIWENGTWNDGIWKNGTWKKGFWRNGIWSDGYWNEGSWEDGTWIRGHWYYGIWSKGLWKNGVWNDGTWENGTWNDGIFDKGTWKNGTWKNGTFINGNWDDGIWKKGNWDGGFWKKGKDDKGNNHIKGDSPDKWNDLKINKEIIAKELVKLAKELIADENKPSYWQVWSLDVWGNEEDGFEVNDRSKLFIFMCNSEDEKDIINAFEKEAKEKGFKIRGIVYAWDDENYFEVNDKKTGKYLLQVEKV